jgi:3-hydroxybutyryl-CoA dehydratase
MNHYKYEDLYIGLTAEFSASVTEEMMAAFCKISGDDNPMHTDEAYAQKHGFDKRLCYGMLTSAFYSTLCGVHLPGELCILHEVSARFPKPVYPGDTLTVKGEITEMTDAYRRIEIKARIHNQNGVLVSSANIKAGIR